MEVKATEVEINITEQDIEWVEQKTKIKVKRVTRVEGEWDICDTNPDKNIMVIVEKK